MEPSSNSTTPLTLADDQLTQQVIDDSFSHFDHEISISLPPAVIFDNLISRVRQLYVTRIAQLDEYRIDHPLGANQARAQRENESQDNIRTAETRAAEQRQQQRDRESDQRIQQVALIMNMQHSADIAALRVKERELREQITALELKADEAQRQHDGQMRDQKTLHMKEMYDFQRQAEVAKSAQAREIEALRQLIHDMKDQAAAAELGNTSHEQQ